jgi:hypothetical protein
MKIKLLVGLMVTALLVTGVGVAAAATPTAATNAPPIVGRGNIVLGQVKAINGATLTIERGQGPELPVVTDAQTRFRARGTSNVTLADIHVGDQVAARGQWQQGRLMARDVLLLPERVTGKVIAVDGETIELTRLDGTAANVVTNADTRFQTQDQQTATLADIQVGDVVVATGQLNGDALTAIRVGFRAPRPQIGPIAVGKINAINGNTLTLELPFAEQLIVDVSSSTFLVKRSDNGPQTIQLSDLAVGDSVLVIGPSRDDGQSIEAKAIVAGKGQGANGLALDGKRQSAPQSQLPSGQAANDFQS